MTLTARPFPPRDVLLAAVKKTLGSYAGTAVTVRQLYYRLVAAGVIPNNLRAYKNLVAALTTWRRGRQIPLSAFEDRTRSMDRYDEGWRNYDPKAWTKRYFEAVIAQVKEYDLAKWYGQSKRVIVAVEKQALQGPFAEVCEELGVDLAVCRGYPSLSFLHEVAKAISDRVVKDGRDTVLLYFGDFDPSGLNIPEVVERDLGPEFFGRTFEFERVALTREQIDSMSLIPAPVKLTDSRADGFVSTHGTEVYELDAIEPNELQRIIRDAVVKHWDQDAAEDRDECIERGKKEVEKLLEHKGLADFLKHIGSQT